MRKIKKYIKRHIKRLVIQFVALISALVIFSFPAAATEHGLEWVFYLGAGSGSTSPGGVYFYTYNYYEGKYHYYPNATQFNGKWFRGISIDKKYDTVAAIFNRPVNVTDFQDIVGNSTEKFYIEFPVHVEFGDDGGVFNGNFNVYLSSLDLMINEDLETVKYRVDLDIDGSKWYNSVAGKAFKVGFVITPQTPILDIQTVSFNFDVSQQTDNYYIQIAPNGPITIKTGNDIPAYAPIASSVLSDYESFENQIKKNNEQGLNKLDSIIDDFTLDSDSSFTRGLLACTQIVNVFNGISVIGQLTETSLVLGAFAFVIGTAVIITNSYKKQK